MWQLPLLLHPSMTMLPGATGPVLLLQGGFTLSLPALAKPNSAQHPFQFEGAEQLERHGVPDSYLVGVADAWVCTAIQMQHL